VWVVNNGTDAFRDRYDGQDFEIAPGAYIEMPPEAAKLSFGWGEEDKSRALRRLGWAATVNDNPRAIERLNAFTFHATEAEAQARASGKGQLSARLESDPAAPGPSGPDVADSSVPARVGSEGLLQKLARTAGARPG
jgi:hypothetical protein